MSVNAEVLRSNLELGFRALGNALKLGYFKTVTRNYDATAGTYTTTEVTTPLRVFLGSYKTREIDGTHIKTGDMKLLCLVMDLPTAVTTDCNFVVDGRTYQAISPSKDALGATYTIQVRPC